MAATSIRPLDGAPSLFSVAFDLGAVGYVAEELLFSGAATSSSGDSAAFTTRVVVHRPADPAHGNGTAVVEWLNVSGGFDVPALWMSTHRHLVREGFVWVGVTVQHVGVHGGGGALPGSGLVGTDDDRYGSLTHPGDAYAFDLFTQAGRMVRERYGVDRLLGVGESQSARFLVTYLNEFATPAGVFDGYLLQGRSGPDAPLDGSFRLDLDRPIEGAAVRIRDDLAVPVLVVQSETDVLGRLRYHPARQPDTDTFRLWEIAGAAHCDTNFLLIAAIDSTALPAEERARLLLASEQPLGLTIELPINWGPQMHYVLHAAIHHLDAWVREAVPPPRAERLAVRESSPPAFVLDEVGNVRDGVRSPWVDAPLATLSGLGQTGPLGQLFGTSQNLDVATIHRLYSGGVAEFEQQFDGATDRAVADGFLLAVDADEIKALGRALYAAVAGASVDRARS